MKTQSGLFSCSRGFTLAELLTTMAIVAILIGLIVPALSLVQKTAQKVRQKSQFHGIDIALESFRTDFGDYPDSSYDSTGVDPGYCGAQKLAEAVVGWDGFGAHPQSAFRSDGMNDVDGDGTRELIYDVFGGITGSGGVFTESAVDNRNVRKGPYLELEASNAVTLRDLYPGDVGTITLQALDTYVLADMFGKVKHRTTHKKTGMPILYYKADVSVTEHLNRSPPMASNVYKVIDNDPVYTTPSPFGRKAPHPLAANLPIFYARTTNPNFPGSPMLPFRGRRPYRSQSFILHSAGRDGLYGTADDVYNFDSEQ